MKAGKERKTDYVYLSSPTLLFKTIFDCLQKAPADGNHTITPAKVKSAGLYIDGFTLCQLEEQETARGLKEERARKRNEKRIVAKLAHQCGIPLRSQKWPIMFSILSLSGGGKEQRCRVGRLEESSVANSIVNIIPHHLLPVKAQAKFVLCYTHGSPVAKSRKTLSGQHEHRRARSHKTMPTVMPTAWFKHKKAILKMSAEISYMFLCIWEDSGAVESQTTPLCKEVDPYQENIWFHTHRAREGKWKYTLQADRANKCESP